MAPPRRRGANKANYKSQFSLGDLVLAKVKGFPFWPAKISRPEDWKKPPDPKKYFVQFFGTEEIAFVAPPDIQIFTVEARNKLSAKSQGKTKFFTQAVKDICKAFDELQKKKSGELRDDTDRSDIGCQTPSPDGVENNEAEIDIKDETGAVTSSGEEVNEEIFASGSRLKSCSQRLGDWGNQDLNPSIACSTGDKKSPFLSSDRKSNTISSIQPKKEISMESAPGFSSHLQKEWSGDKNRVLPNGHKLQKMVSVSRKKTGDTVEGKRKSSFLTSLKGDDDCINKLESGKQLKDETKGKSFSGSSNVSLGSEISARKKVKGGVITKSNSKVLDDAPNPMVDPEEQLESKFFDRSKKAQIRVARPNMGKIETFHPAKKSKLGDAGGDATGKPSPKSLQGSSPISIDNKTVKKSELRRSTSRVKAENHVALNSEKDVIDRSKKVSGDDAVSPVTKHHCLAPEEMLDASTISNNKVEKNFLAIKKELTTTASHGVVLAQSQKKRRAVCLYDDDDDEDAPRTPIHGGYAPNLKVQSCASDDNKISDADKGSGAKAQGSINGSSEVLDIDIKELSLHLPNGSSPCNPLNDNKSPDSQHQTSEKRPEMQPPIDESRNEIQLMTYNKKPEKVVKIHYSPGKLKVEQLSKEAKSISASPHKSPVLLSASKPVVEQHKFVKSSVKTLSLGCQKKAQAAPDKVFGSVCNSQNQLTVQRNRMASAGENSKATPKSVTRTNEIAVLRERSIEPSERLEGCREEKGGLLVDSRTPDSAFSMKHLIAAAQAKRRQALTKNLTFGFPNSAFAPTPSTDVQGASPSPPAVQHFSSGGSNPMLADFHGSYNDTTVGSPSRHAHHSAAQNQLDNEEVEERRVSSGHRTAGGSLSGGTEASVARDAFEGMIETLSRTKESIGRATRLAIECAKYGIAYEVVELLIRKLESEPSYHRKVDLFFLVDSITQCSHNQKGIAGASYVPTVQAALPRLLGAAAPTGSGARENRRQCLKVLRLWLERKILPESLLRRYMDDIEVPNEDTTAGFSLRRPSRAERAFDDPIREMEGMLVDEYGSNATFQIPGFFSSNVFGDEEEEEALESSSYKENGHPLQLEAMHASEDSELHVVTPNDRRHCILEDVDGELEMEDVDGELEMEDVDGELEMEYVPGHPKNEKSLPVGVSYEMDLQQQVPDRVMGPAPVISDDMPPLPYGSPPLPPESPPLPPPLPTSPPPPPPPSPPPPLPPPPPMPPLELPPIPLPCPPPLLVSQSSLSTQPPLTPQQMLPSQSSGQSSPQMAYQIQVPHTIANGNGKTGNTPQQGPMDNAVNSEMFQQHPPCYIPTGVCGPREPSGFTSLRQVEHGNNEMYLSQQVPQPNQVPQGNAPYVQRPLHPAPPYNHPSHLLYTKPAIKHHPQHPYHHQYPLPSLPDGQRQIVADEQWRIPSNEFNTDNQHGIWINGGRTPAAPPFCQEGFFRPPFERPLKNNMGFQQSVPNIVSIGPSASGLSVPQILPSIPDISAHNCWRPA